MKSNPNIFFPDKDVESKKNSNPTLFILNFIADEQEFT